MARKFLTNIDLQNNILLNSVLTNTHSSPNTAGALQYSGGKIVFGNGTNTSTVATMADTVTVGSTAITIGGTATTLAGLTSVTSTTFVGALTGNASTATTAANLSTSYGSAPQILVQSGTNTTTLLATGTLGQVLIQGPSGPTYSSSPNITAVGTLTGLTMGGNIAMGNNKITGLGAPTADGDAATKLYVDTVSAGINVHEAVKYATTGALGTTGNLVGGTITTTYANGTSGLGATITVATSSNWTAITIDGQSLTVSDRVLIKDQAANLQNGIYTVTQVGSVGNTTSFIFTRAVDNDQSPEIDAGDLTYVVAGTTNGGDGYVQTAANVTVGTTGVVWTQFSGAGSVPLATTSAPGIASFPTAQFSVSGAGAVQIDNLSGNLVTSGTVADGRIASALTGKTYNALTLTAAATGFTVAGGTTSKTLTVSNTLTLAGTDSSTLNIGTGGTLGSAAFTATSAYLASNATVVNGTTIPNAVTLLHSTASGVQTFLTTPNSANLRAALTDEDGTGALIFAGGNIGAATATTPTAGDSSQKVATTAFVANAVASSGTNKYTATNSSITPSSGTATWSIPATTHLLGNTPALLVQMFQVSDGAMVDVDVLVDQTAGTSAPTGNVTVSWNASATVSAATYRIVIIG